MKLNVILYTAIIIASSLFTACKKDSVEPVTEQKEVDYRDEIIGQYSGIRVFTDFNSNPYSIDTNSNLMITLSKNALDDSVVELSFAATNNGNNLLFKYANGEFTSLLYSNHRPTLTMDGDSLYYYHKPGLAPIWNECFVNKVP